MSRIGAVDEIPQLIAACPRIFDQEVRAAMSGQESSRYSRPAGDSPKQVGALRTVPSVGARAVACASLLAHVPARWTPLRRQEHAPFNDSGACRFRWNGQAPGTEAWRRHVADRASRRTG